MRVWLDKAMACTTWLCLLLLTGLLLDYAPSKVGAKETESSHRFADKPFPRKMSILNQTVSCGIGRPGKFIAQTYTCADLRVNGRRLAYGLYAGWEVGQSDKRCQDTKGIHEFAQLCRMMLEYVTASNSSLGLKAVYIPNSTCSYINESRKLLKKLSEEKFIWTDQQAGWGWTTTIQCMTDVADPGLDDV